MWKKTVLVLVSLSVFGLSASGRPAYAKDETWVQVTSPHFVVVSDAGEGQARRIAGQFERMRALFLALFPNTNSGPSILVLAVRDRKDFRLLEPQAYLARGALDLAGLFGSFLADPGRHYILLRLDAGGEHPYADIYHEYTHFLLRGDQNWMPLWLNEGLAEFFQNTDIDGNQALLGQPSSDDILYLRDHRLLPLPMLFRVDHASPYYHEEEKGSVFYAESWALVHYFQVTDRTKDLNQLVDYANRVRQKEDPVTAAQEAFGDLTKLQETLEEYVRQISFQEFTAPVPAGADPASWASRSVSLPQANAYRAGILASVGRTQDARTELDSVLREDPDNVLAHETMGVLELQAHNLASARTWYAQAVRLGLQSFMAQYNFATLSIAAGNLTAEDQAQIETSLRAAIRLNPSFAPAYDQLASFYGMRHERLDEAHLLEVQAVELDPDNIPYRMNAATGLLEMGQIKNATDVLRAALAIAKTPGQTALIQSRLNQLENRERAQAAVPESQTKALQPPETQVVRPAPAALHPDEAPHGPLLMVEGTIQSVQCSYPTALEMKVAASSGKTISLYSNNYFKVEFDAANFTPTKDFNPCMELQGMKARVAYSEPSDKTMNGQIVSVTVTK